MVDADVVAGGVGVACHGDTACPGGVDGGTLGGCQVNALVVGRRTGGGADTVAEGATHVHIAAGPQPGSIGGSGAGLAAAGVAAAIVTAAAVVGVAIVGRCGGGRGHSGVGGHVSQPLLQLCLVVFLLLLSDHVQELGFLDFKVLPQFLEFIALGQKLRDQCVCLFPLGIQFCLGLVQFLLGHFQIGLFRFQFGLGFFHPLGSFAQLLQTAVIGSRDLFHHVQPVQQIREAVGFE